MRSKLAILLHTLVFFGGIALLSLTVMKPAPIHCADLAHIAHGEVLCYRCADSPDQAGDIRTIKVNYKKFRSIYERDEFVVKQIADSPLLVQIQNQKEISLAQYEVPAGLYCPLFLKYAVLQI